LTAEFPSGLLVERGRSPGPLPTTLGDINPPLRPIWPDDARPTPTTLFLTVDVEDCYFDRPILMSGDGIGRKFGVFGILDALDVRSLKGTFFVNVYEKDHQPPGVVEGVVREIAERGHEVGLHTHPSRDLDFYQRPLFRLSRSAQIELLRWGADLVEKWTQERPVSFRAGGYALNDDTFAALEATGFIIDSSCFFPSPNNHITRRTVNLVSHLKKMVEVPVTTVLRVTSSGDLAHRKLDLNWLSVDELAAALAVLGRHGARYAMFMMHSFSFIEKSTRMPEEPPSPQARFVSEVHLDRYVEVRGPKPMMRESFSQFLDQVTADDAVRIRTLRDALHSLHVEDVQPEDVVPIVG
jgi:peptidoglycan/xylan/chitin deacetylase (PgdA/CDA1 family)